jgi:hypothetical protein
VSRKPKWWHSHSIFYGKSIAYYLNVSLARHVRDIVSKSSIGIGFTDETCKPTTRIFRPTSFGIASVTSNQKLQLFAIGRTSFVCLATLRASLAWRYVTRW